MGRLISGLFVMGLLGFLATTLPEANSVNFRATASVTSVAKLTALCAKGFDLKISVDPATAEGESIGLFLHSEPKAKQATAKRSHSGEEFKLSEETCRRWEKESWPLLKQVLQTHKSKDRAGLVCQNFASVEYRVATDTGNEKVCLGAASADKVTASFRKFYEGTDLLLGR